MAKLTGKEISREELAAAEELLLSWEDKIERIDPAFNPRHQQVYSMAYALRETAKPLSSSPKCVEAARMKLIKIIKQFNRCDDGSYSDDFYEVSIDTIYKKDAKQILQAAEEATKCKKCVMLSSVMEKETLCPECEEAEEAGKEERK